jgi:hypothetical protein
MKLSNIWIAVSCILVWGCSHAPVQNLLGESDLETLKGNVKQVIVEDFVRKPIVLEGL